MKLVSTKEAAEYTNRSIYSLRRLIRRINNTFPVERPVLHRHGSVCLESLERGISMLGRHEAIQRQERNQNAGSTDGRNHDLP